jgi:hypothetical protein
MNCGQFETRLNLLLDQRRSPASDSALAEHAAACAACDELLADHVALLSCASVSRASYSRLPRVSADFSQRVVAAVRPIAIPQRRTRRLFMAACVALSSAAAMLLAISIVWKARQPGPSGGEPIVASHGMNSADFLVGAPHLWSTELSMAGSSLRFDEVDRIAPAFRPLRESLAIIWDALRRAWGPTRDVESQPAEKRTGQWAVFGLSIA